MDDEENSARCCTDSASARRSSGPALRLPGGRRRRGRRDLPRLGGAGRVRHPRRHEITDARTLAGQIGLAKTMRKYDLHRVITFHSRVKRRGSSAPRCPR